MRLIHRAVAVLGCAAALSGCGLIRDSHDLGPAVPEPITPTQHAIADTAVIADFNARLEKYVKAQRVLLKRAPVAEDATPAEINASQQKIAAQLRQIRKNAKQGAIFTPQVAAMFKRLLAPELKGADRRETRQALEEEDGEVAQVWLRVNATWPASEPLTTMPATMLAKLPQLPPDVEYRITNKRHLVLRDVDANIIVDFIYNAIR